MTLKKPDRVIFLVSTFPKVSETFITNRLAGLIDRGIEVEIISTDKPDESYIHSGFQDYDLMQKTEYLPLPKNKFDIESWLLNRALRVVLTPFLLAKNLHKSPSLILKSFNLFKFGKNALSLKLFYLSLVLAEKDDPDIIHSHFGPPGELGAEMLENGLQTEIVTTFHGWGVERGKEKGKNIYRYLFKHSDALISNSNHTKSQLLDLGAKDSQIKTISPGVDLELFENPRNTKNNIDKVKILSLGRLKPVKGLKNGLEVVRRLQTKTDKNIRYDIIGDGEERKKLEDMAQELDIQNITTFHGYMDQEEVARRMRNADIFLFPSNYETLGVAAIEAQSCKTPVVATSAGGIPESVKDGETGFVKENNISALSEALVRLVENPELRSKMGENGRKHVKNRYDLEKQNNMILEKYSSVLD